MVTVQSVKLKDQKLGPLFMSRGSGFKRGVFNVGTSKSVKSKHVS